MSDVMFSTGSVIGKEGTNFGVSMSGWPPIALSALATFVMCSISSIATPRIISCSHDDVFVIE